MGVKGGFFNALRPVMSRVQLRDLPRVRGRVVGMPPRCVQWTGELRMATVCSPWAALCWQSSGLVDGGAVASSRVRRQRRLSHFEAGMMAFAACRTSR